MPEESLLWRKGALDRKANSLEENRVRHLLTSGLREEWDMGCCLHRVGYCSYLDGGRNLKFIWGTQGE